MKQLRLILTVVMMAAILSVPALTEMTALGQKNDNRPPKEQPKIKENPKPPPNNNSQGNNNRRKP